MAQSNEQGGEEPPKELLDKLRSINVPTFTVEHGVIDEPLDTVISTFEIEKIYRVIAAHLLADRKQHEQAIYDRLIGEAKTCYDCVHEENDDETPVKFVPVSVIKKLGGKK